MKVFVKLLSDFEIILLFIFYIKSFCTRVCYRKITHNGLHIGESRSLKMISVREMYKNLIQTPKAEVCTSALLSPIPCYTLCLFYNN